MRRFTSWLLACAVAVAMPCCFNPNTNGVDITCTVEDPRCLEGQVCIAGHCITQAPEAGLPADLGGDAGVGQPDMARSGCANGAGTQVGGAWACPGTFPRGNAVKQCAAKFSVCKTADSVDLSACNAIDGFFVSDALGYSGFPACRNVDPIFFQCTAFQPGMDNRLRFGCGGLAKPYALTGCTSQCAGFDRALNCSQEVDYTCGASLGLGDEANLLPSSGVLCCPG